MALLAVAGASAGVEASSGGIADRPHFFWVRFRNPGDVIRFVNDSLRGRSGSLFARFVAGDRREPSLPIFIQLFGDTATRRPGVYPVPAAGSPRPFSFIALHAFSEKRGPQIGAYRIGFWPAESASVHPEGYANPNGFIEVTRENADLHISEHFRLRDFLTHDQAAVWPKYLVLREDLIDKLELVIAELQRSGTPVRHMTVMSGFRTPEYNAHGGETAGRDELSRHMYGDASDVFVDNNGDGRMDDLNHDGRVDYRDAQLIIAASERVELSHPDLVGGGGVYRATNAHGPFAHIDVRGTRERWGLTQ
ncbi:MAG TPA: hypothetical protein VK636_19775 [Gemmatimonadaceae bacterium]|nr:hypothetical protein [Gemmatimonadaceae bacterium]